MNQFPTRLRNFPRRLRCSGVIVTREEGDTIARERAVPIHFNSCQKSCCKFLISLSISTAYYPYYLKGLCLCG